MASASRSSSRSAVCGCAYSKVRAAPNSFEGLPHTR